MRYLLPLFVLGLAASACRCGPEAPTEVRLRIVNGLAHPIYVQDSDGRMGLKVKREVAGQWLSFVESPCECLRCDRVCDTACLCPTVDERSRAIKIAPAGTAERSWDGVVQLSGTGPCASLISSGPPCLTPENPPPDEVFRLELCYALSAPGAEEADAGESVPATLPEDSIVCVEKPFRPQDGEVQISPQRGAQCTDHAGCTGEDELCFGGSCTTACPAAGFPRLGAAWQVRLPEPADQGFFTITRSGDRELWTGTGSASAVRYDNNTMTVQLERGPTGAKLRGALSVALPQGVAVPLSVGETLRVTVVDASTDQNPENRAVVLHGVADDGKATLLLLADTAQQGLILTPEQSAPFLVTRAAGPVGCEHTECGKNLFERTRFSAGAEVIELAPGTTERWAVAEQVWQIANVASERYLETWCSLAELMPYVVANQRAGTGP